MQQLTLFDLPTVPEEFGVVLPASNLRTIEYTSLDFENLRRTAIEYVRTYYPNDFNDFVVSNGMIMLIEILASIGSKLGLRGDLLWREAFFPTATTENAIVNHLALIGQKRQRATAATTKIEVSVPNPVTSTIEIPPGIVFEVKGPDSQPIYYEIYKSPEDFTSNIVIQPNKRGVVAFGLEGKFADDYVIISNGGPNQVYTIQSSNILESPITVTVENDESVTNWEVTNDDLELYGPNDKVVNVALFSDRVEFKFGNNINGTQPLSGSTIRVRYRTGGGTRGRIGVGVIDKFIPVTPTSLGATVQTRFRNIEPSSGGTDIESLENVKKRAPRSYATHDNITTGTDYAVAATSYVHPVFGSASKAIAAVTTGYNANIVQLYILSSGIDNTLITSNIGLKNGLKTYIEDLNPFSTKIEVLDGRVKNIDLDINVVINKNSNGSIVKTAVDNVISEFFKLDNWNFGTQFYVSDLISEITAVPGVLYVDLLSPANNILLGTGTDDDIVGFDEIIILGSQQVRYFYEKPKR